MSVFYLRTLSTAVLSLVSSLQCTLSCRLCTICVCVCSLISLVYLRLDRIVKGSRDVTKGMGRYHVRYDLTRGWHACI